MQETPVRYLGSPNHLSVAIAKSLQSRPTLCDPIDGSPPGSPVPGILQARVLEWGAIAFSILVLAIINICVCLCVNEN